MLIRSVFIMYFKIVLLAILSVSVVGPSAKKRNGFGAATQTIGRSKAPELEMVRDIPAIIAANRVHLAPFNQFRECSSVYAIAVAGAIATFIGKQPTDKSTTFTAFLETTMAKQSSEYQDVYQSINFDALGIVAAQPRPEDLAGCTPLKSHTVTFFSMSKEYAELIRASTQRLLTILKQGQKPIQNAASALDAIIGSFTQEQLNVLNAMAELDDSHRQWNVDGETGDFAALFRVLDEQTFAEPDSETENYLVPIYTLLRRLKIATGEDIIRKDLFHATDKDLPSKLELILKGLPVSVVPAAPSTISRTVSRPDLRSTTDSSVSGVDVGPQPGTQPGTDSKLEDQPTSPIIPSNKLDSQTTIISSIATQEKLFFTNFHIAAQQLSLLGIKAVGLATQIQAIRGHMMMLKLIDEHIITLTADEKKYTELLQKAHIELRQVVEIPPTEGAAEGG